MISKGMILVVVLLALAVVLTDDKDNNRFSG